MKKVDFLVTFSARMTNINGDPDADNLPRTVGNLGLLTSVAVKRRVRDAIEVKYRNAEGKEIFIKNGSNLNLAIAEASVQAGGSSKKTATKSTVQKARDIMCRRFWDVRTFGAVMSTGANAGQVTGPVQLTMGVTLDPVTVQSIAVTRSCKTLTEGKDVFSVDAMKELEDEASESSLRTIGRQSFVEYGLYAMRGSVSAFRAEQTGFTEEDLKDFFWALKNSYELFHTSSKGEIDVDIYVFTHEGTDSDLVQRENQARLGVCPAQNLLEIGRIVDIQKNVETPMSYRDYDVTVHTDRIPAGISYTRY